ncbi:hypothetical protein SDRG_04983 [Saprolegnia diclina VS20]|uniref:Potassium channel tetramerisation-type BTB domain-containing protein n=1 Tax=Saprolegnia diclina (strain VS20) TaxID=1156394 RepID=T0QHE9_SAPDV|nr:hypothetical protein SDRG_04983 [Saprolegnia diclina VS20]EQC37379.1 hypothetical protein SDRG_04983 [Saprolegnia diclina VS20]|eukprot:XP_008608899.1 hypothetical protein SDRG_04983 [Saprolegnia diclina VS20]
MVDGVSVGARWAALHASMEALLDGNDTLPPALRCFVNEMDTLVTDVVTTAEAQRQRDDELRQRETHIETQLSLLAHLTGKRCACSDVPDEPTASTTIVTLNVGGTLFMTARETLLRIPGSYFDAMLSSDHWRPNAKDNEPR